MSTPVQLGPFERVSLYDAPNTIFSQIIDGEATTTGMWKTLFDPNGLTPAERDGINQRLKRSAGGNSVVGALIDIATNPFTWFMFLTTPAAAKVGGDLFKVAPKFSRFVNSETPTLATMGALSPMMVVRGTRTGAAMHQIEQGVRKMMDQNALILSDSWDAMLKKLGVEDLDHTSIRSAGKRAEVQDFQATLEAALGGWHIPGRTFPYPVARLDETGKTTVSVEQIVSDWAGTVDPSKILKERWGDDAIRLRDSLRLAFNVRAETVFRDSDAILRIYRGFANPAVVGAEEAVAQHFAAQVLGPLAEHVRAGDITFEQFHRMIQETVIDPIRANKYYFPANAIDTFVGPNIVPPETRRDAVHAGLLRADFSSRGRKGTPIIYHPDDMIHLKSIIGGNEAMDKMIEQGQAIMRESAAGPRAVKFFRINADRSINRYFDQTGRTYAFFVQDIGDELRQVDAHLRTDPIVAEGMSKATDASLNRYGFGQNIAGETIPISERFTSTNTPLGGWSLADAIYADWATVKDRYAKDTIRHVIVDHGMGRVSTKNATTLALMNFNRNIVKSFVNSPISDAIASSHEWGNKMIQRMKGWVDEPFTTGDAARLTAGVSGLLYQSHLGLNMASAIINMTQPLLFAGSWMGYKNVLRGYKESFGEIATYLKERAKFPLTKPLSFMQQQEIARKSFKFWDELGAGRTAMETVDRLTFAAERLARHNRPRKEIIFDAMMAPFTLSEITARNVTAHAAMYSQGVEDIAKLSAMQMGRVRETVWETQFGAHWMNTPITFLPHRAPTGTLDKASFLRNPLARQFMSFPLRSTLALFHTSPKLAGREGAGRFWGFLKDYGRAMGMSALMYEVFKNAGAPEFGERTGIQSAVTDILPGFQAGRLATSDKEWGVPLPPAAEVPLNFIRATIGQDWDLMRNTIPRTIPGGVAASRALGVLPDLPNWRGLAGLPGALQKTHADWANRTPDGRVPVYDGAGVLNDYRTPAELIFRGLGVDLGAWQNGSELDHFLVKNRDEAVRYRQQYLRHMLSNESGKAASVAGEYQKRFGVPLTVTKSQLQQALRMRETPRTERVLDRLPPDIRPQYQQLLASGNTGRIGTTPEQLVAATSARTREAFRPKPALDAETVAALRELVAQTEKQRKLGKSFQSPEAY